MDAAWVGVVGALGGVIVGAIAETLRTRATFKREKGWAVRDERRSHLEELWSKLDALSAGYNSLIAKANGSKEWVALTQQRADDPELPWDRVRLLISLYLPEYRSRLVSLESSGIVLDEALRSAESRSFALPSEKMHADLMDAAADFDDAVEAARESITVETRAITDARYASASASRALRR
jgi:hypothetical protein